MTIHRSIALHRRLEILYTFPNPQSPLPDRQSPIPKNLHQLPIGRDGGEKAGAICTIERGSVLLKIAMGFAQQIPSAGIAAGVENLIAVEVDAGWLIAADQRLGSKEGKDVVRMGKRSRQIPLQPGHMGKTSFSLDFQNLILHTRKSVLRR